MTWGFPTDEDFPFVLDCATSVTQRGKLEVCGREGKQLPEGWVIGEDGNYRTDTIQVLEDLTKGKAALTPLGGLGELTGGYKGYGYAFVVEILSAALSDANNLKDLNGKDEKGIMSSLVGMLKKKKFMTYSHENMLFVNPPLIITEEQIREEMVKMDEVLTYVDNELI